MMIGGSRGPGYSLLCPTGRCAVRLMFCLVRVLILVVIVGIGIVWLYRYGPMSERYRAHREYAEAAARLVATAARHGAAMARVGNECRSEGGIALPDLAALAEHADAITRARKDFLSLAPPPGWEGAHTAIATRFERVDQAAQAMMSLARVDETAKTDLTKLQRTLDSMAAEGEKVLDLVGALESTQRSILKRRSTPDEQDADDRAKPR
jgi:hypothetical protein